MTEKNQNSSPWRNPYFQTLNAWVGTDKDRTENKTYWELNLDLDSFLAAQQPQSQTPLVIEDQGPYQNLLHYLAAWESGRPLCLLPKTWPEKWKIEINERVSRMSDQIPADCFYLLPTSGSTGSPKLVVVARKNWKRLMQNLETIYRWPVGTRVALTFEGVFDPFIAMIFLTFDCGGTLVPLPSAQRFDIFRFMKEQAIQVWASVPSLVSLNWGRQQIAELPQLQCSLFTGEVLTDALAKKWQALAPAATIDNLYGPVETTVWATHFRYLETDGITLPIGRPFPGVNAKVENQELIISGSQVATGYLTNEGLQPFNENYCTGDLVIDDGGCFRFLGRRDQQVKFLGSRVELEATENAFFSETGLGAICCLDEEQNICLVTSATEKKLEFDPETVGAALRRKLPGNHVPRFWYLIDFWRLLPSGKIDRALIRELLLGRKLQPVQMLKGNHDNP